MAYKTKEDICMDCNLFHDTCMGEKFERQEKRIVGKTSLKGCKHQVKSPTPVSSPIQVAACRSLFNAKVTRGMDKHTAFMEAIVQSSDEAFAEAMQERSSMVSKWEDNKTRYNP